MEKWVSKKGKTGLIRGISTEKGDVVVRWHGIGSPSSEAGQSRAALIAAAPDLLEALIAMLPENNVEDEKCRPSFETCERARIAISKAKGE